ncbi:SDR family oxidoreductase [Desulfovibrio sp. SGI.169]|uniref:SDR family oxidoreductase n=1 Tax=Desulfovibrio sp. SGI.169 TaxID=3420561 RepID=UPI003D04A82F
MQWPRGDFCKNMFARCPAGRPGTVDEVAHVAELLLGPQGSFITGADFLVDGGAAASFFYGSLRPESDDNRWNQLCRKSHLA